MVLHVRQVGDEYYVPLSPEVVDALHLRDGAAVEVRSIEAATPTASVRCLTNDEALDLYRSTEPQHRRAYEELAK